MMPFARPPITGVLLLTASVVSGTTAGARTLYVSATIGSNANSGLTATKPFATLQYAAGLTAPGDTVMVMAGTYTNTSAGSDILWISRSGTAAAPITYKNYSGQTATLRSINNWAAIRITANYIVVDGLNIVGNAASISSSYGMSQAQALDNSLTNGDGLDINQPSTSVVPNHITVQNMVIHDVPGGGIGADNADYITIQNNYVYNTSNWSPYGDSAISVYEATDIDHNTGYKVTILHNTTFNNRELVPCVCRKFQSISDGNGIIIDDSLHSQSDNVAYGGRSLIAYNISSDNGGSGIHAYSSAHIDILHNTTYNDEQVVPYNEGEIFSDTGSDVRIVDNILSAGAGKIITSSNGNTSQIYEDYNILWNIGGALKPPSTPGAHDILADPKLINPVAGNFGLQLNSRAWSSAAPSTALATLVPTAAAAAVAVAATAKGVTMSNNRGAD